MMRLVRYSIRPKPKGTIRTLAVWHNYNWETDALKPSLERFGPVRLYDWFEEFDHSRKDWSRAIKPRMNRALVDLVDEVVDVEKRQIAAREKAERAAAIQAQAEADQERRLHRAGAI